MDWHEAPFRHLHTLYEPANKPMSMHVDLTYRCPLKCVHCYATDMEDYHADLMDTAMIKSLLRQARDLGVLYLVFSGGEPWLRKDLLELVSYARELQFLVRIKTSGVLITQKDVDLFKQLGLVWIDISIHGMNPETHDAVTRIPGSHEKAMHAVHMLHDAGVPVWISMSMLSINYREYPQLKAYFDDLGIEVNQSIWLSPGQVIGDEVRRYEMDREMTLEAFKMTLTDKEPDYQARTTVPLSERLCFAGRTSFHVGPDGIVHPCILWPEIAGDLKKQSLKEIWVNSPLFRRIRGLTGKDRTGCRSCNLYGYCDFCPGRAFQEAGDAILPYKKGCEGAQLTREAYERRFGFAPDAPPKP